MPTVGFPGGSDGKESACSAEDLGSIPGSGRSPGGGHGNPLLFLPGESPWTEEPGGLQSLGHTEVDTAERLSRAHTALRAMRYAECFSHMIYITFYLMFPIYQQGSHAHFADEENLRLRRPGQLPRFQNHKVTERDMEPRLI